MVEQTSFRVEAAAVLAAVGPAALAARAACVVATLRMSPKAARWGRNLRGVAARSWPRTIWEDPLLADVSEAVGVGRCGVDTDWPRQQVPGTATLS
jgi:hypothetical protein